MKRPFFAVLGGMGTLATQSYIRRGSRATHANADQTGATNDGVIGDDGRGTPDHQLAADS